MRLSFKGGGARVPSEGPPQKTPCYETPKQKRSKHRKHLILSITNVAFCEVISLKVGWQQGGKGLPSVQNGGGREPHSEGRVALAVLIVPGWNVVFCFP